MSAERLAKNVALFTSTSEGFFSDNYFDIIPGKTYKIRYTGFSDNLDSELELKCINEIYN